MTPVLKRLKQLRKMDHGILENAVKIKAGKNSVFATLKSEILTDF
jgi:hypothetical protein